MAWHRDTTERLRRRSNSSQGYSAGLKYRLKRVLKSMLAYNISAAGGSCLGRLEARGWGCRVSLVNCRAGAV